MNIKQGSATCYGARGPEQALEKPQLLSINECQAFEETFDSYSTFERTSLSVLIVQINYSRLAEYILCSALGLYLHLSSGAECVESVGKEMLIEQNSTPKVINERQMFQDFVMVGLQRYHDL